MATVTDGDTFVTFPRMGTVWFALISLILFAVASGDVCHSRVACVLVLCAKTIFLLLLVLMWQLRI